MTPEQIEMLIESRLPTWVVEHDKRKIIDHMLDIINQLIAEEREKHEAPQSYDDLPACVRKLDREAWRRFVKAQVRGK